MANPTFAQMQEFFRQSEAGKINDSSFQLFLEGLREVRPFTLEEFGEMIRHIKCPTENCKGFHHLSKYEHPHGWRVANHMRRQWLSTICSHCHRQTSLQYWGIPINIVKS